jgi:hypothetical protein
MIDGNAIMLGVMGIALGCTLSGALLAMLSHKLR